MGVNNSNHNYRRLINNQVDNNILFAGQTDIFLTKDMVSYSTVISGLVSTSKFEYSPSNNRIVFMSQRSNLISYSNDLGWTWTDTSISQVGRPQYASDIKYSPSLGKWCIFSGWNWCTAVNTFTSGLTLSVLTSSDGINWSQSIVATSSTTKSTEFRALEWAENLGKFVAIPTGTDRGWVSSNGTSWTQTTTTFSSGIQCAKWSNDIDIFVAGGSNQMLKSYDANTWTDATTSFSGSLVLGIDWSPSLSMFVAICRRVSPPYNVEMWRSTDGDTWVTSATFSGSTGAFFSISWVGNQFVGVCGQGNDYMVRSSDGINWATYSVPDKLLYDIQYIY